VYLIEDIFNCLQLYKKSVKKTLECIVVVYVVFTLMANFLFVGWKISFFGLNKKNSNPRLYIGIGQ